jgi:hypothetical protein
MIKGVAMYMVVNIMNNALNNETRNVKEKITIIKKKEKFFKFLSTYS